MNRFLVCSILIVLIAQCASIFGAADCGSNGVVQDDNCVCYSGFVSSTPDNQDCSVTVPGTCTWDESTATVTAGSASLTSATFSANSLVLIVESHVVTDRQLTNIAIGNSTDPACVYPGANFIKTLDDATCSDEFTGTVAWTDASSKCNFVEDTTSDPNSVIYTSSVYVTSQQVTTLRGKPVIQYQTDTLLVSVKFQKQISVSSTTSVVAPVNMFSAVTDQSFSPADQKGSVSFATSLQWPFALTAGVITSLPTGLTADVAGLVEQVSSDDCTDTEDSTCFQVFNYKIVPGAVCQLTGQYVISFTVDCRGTDACPLDASSPPAVLTLSLTTADFCAAVETGITATASMGPYQDAAFTTAKTAFFQGQTAFFLVNVASAQAAVSQSVISAISVTIGGTATPLYTTADGILNTDVLAAVTNGADTANFAVTFDAGLFTAPVDGSLDYQFSVDVQVAFEGNTVTKRTIFSRTNGPTTKDTRATAQVSLQQVPANIQNSAASTSCLELALIGGIVLLSLIM